MSIPGQDAVIRFQENEVRLDDFLNTDGTYLDRFGNPVETLPSLTNTVASMTLTSVFLGNWSTSHAYNRNEIVKQNYINYICKVAHTSGTFATDLAANKWQIYQPVLSQDINDEIHAIKYLKMDGTDETTTLQALWDMCSSDTAGITPTLVLAPGIVKGHVVCKKQFINVRGSGMWGSFIDFGTASAGITTNAMQYLRPFFRDFGVVSASGTGKAIDFSPITGEVYLGEIRNIYLSSVGDGFYAPLFFSMLMSNVACSSSTGHSFRVACGPGVLWNACYALNCGPNKAGYRLTGTVNMKGCNGLNSGDWWGVFGNDTTASDGFQSDFAGNDYPDVNLDGCNIEEFSSLTVNGGGVMLHNAYKNVQINGGKIDRQNPTSAYKAIIYARLASAVGNIPIRLNVASLFLGSGTPSLAHLYTGNNAYFYDESRAFVSGGITTWKDGGSGGITYPLLTMAVTNDLYNDSAWFPNAITPRRLSVRMIRYKTTTLTPVGSAQAIVVTGYTKVIVTPAAAASIATATFAANPGLGDDYGRNGELVIEAGNANLTVNHSASGADTFKMSAGANLAMTSGQVIKFLRSETNGNWVQA